MRIERARWHDDAHGRCVEVRVSDPPEGALVLSKLLRVHAKGERWYASRLEDDADEAGDFFRVAPIEEGRATFYVPWGALAKPEHGGKDRMTVMAVHGDEGVESAREDYETELRPSPSYSRLEIVKPLLGLCLAVAYADGVLRRSEVRCLREFFTTTLKVPAAEHGALRGLMRTCPGDDLAPLARVALYRQSARSAATLCRVLEIVAAADGRVSAAEIAVIERVAKALGVEGAIARGSDAVADDPWEVFGLSPGAEPKEAEARYRELIKQWHPDRYATAPAPIREMAHRETQRMNAALVAIQNAQAAEEDDPGMPRPEPAPLAAFGVEGEARWVNAERYRPEPAPPAVPAAAPAAPPPDPLAGWWRDANGNSVAFYPQGAGYRVEEHGMLGKTGEGYATRQGALVHVQVRNLLLGQYAATLQLNGPWLQGTVSVMGIPMPLTFFRA